MLCIAIVDVASISVEREPTSLEAAILGGIIGYLVMKIFYYIEEIL